MALLHAIQLFAGLVTTTTSPGATLYTVPAGSRIIIRSIQLRNVSGSTQVFTFRLGSLVIFSPSLVGSASTFQGGLWWVLMPGDTFKLQAGLAAGGNVLVSGSIYDI